MTTWDYREKPGDPEGGWDYNEARLSYDEDKDPDTDLDVFYNNLGEPSTWTNQTKS